MKNTTILLLIFSCQVFGVSTWLEKLDDSHKQEQLDLRWIASGGEIDIQFMHAKLNTMKIELSPQPYYPNKHWSKNHLVFSIQKDSKIDLQVPYGNIEKVTSGQLTANTDFSLTHGKTKIDIKTLTLAPNPRKKDAMDIATFKLIDQLGRHLFNTDNNHIQYSADKKLLQMKHMDISASKELALLLKMPELENQLLGQVNTYSHLSIPKNAQFETKGGNCLTNPNFQNSGNFTDVQLTTMGNVSWLNTVTDTSKLYLAPSATLINVGTADIPWFTKLSGDFAPYDNDQHPYLNWAVYREIDNRFEQIGISELKHAFFSTNVICDCPGGNILGVGCGDLYGKASNDLPSALGPREELNAFSGIWDSCGSFFDPNCLGPPGPVPAITSGSNTTGDNRLSINPADIVPDLYMQAWYVVRDDIDIFNSMGYKRFSPQLFSTSWVMNTDPAFSNGAAIENYVPKNTISTMQSSQTITTNEGHFTVAVKVIDLSNGFYRYNYAVENYDFDPSFNRFKIPLALPVALINPIFSDPDDNDLNDWVFNVTNGELEVIGNSANEQKWGMLFSFSVTLPAPPMQGIMTIEVASPNTLNQVSSPVLTPDLSNFLFVNGFE
jgi:hypothetical protein